MAVAGLAACGSEQQSAVGATDLTVHVGVYGGPLLPDGHMAASNAPQRGARITVTDAAGRTWRMRTDRLGIASFAVPAGHYAIHGPCGPTDPKSAVVHPARIVHVRIRCDVP